jgi:hypothetical protein
MNTLTVAMLPSGWEKLILGSPPSKVLLFLKMEAQPATEKSFCNLDDGQCPKQLDYISETHNIVKVLYG